MKTIFLIGYSGHAFVVADSAAKAGYSLKGYFETEEKKLNPFGLSYLGKETQFNFSSFRKNDFCFTSVGDNNLRQRIYKNIGDNSIWTNVIDTTSAIADHVELEMNIYIGKCAVVNPLAILKKGCIVNTGAIVEHECRIGEFVHVAPGAVLCGNVEVGDRSFIGANSVIRQGIKVGADVIIGAGSVITKNVPDHAVVYGNPAKIIKK